GPPDGGLLRAKWSVERQQDERLRGYPNKADGPAIWLGPPAEAGGREELLLAVPSAGNEHPDERVRAEKRWRDRHPDHDGAAPIRRVALAAPDLSSLLPLARMPLAERAAAVAELSDDIEPRSVTLTLDARLQAALAPAVKAAAARSSVGAAALVVLDPVTGEVLARVQWPDYDPAGTEWRKKRLAGDPKFMGIYGAWSDKTGAHGIWQAGSVFKILSAVAAVKAGKVETPVDLGRIKGIGIPADQAATTATCPASATPRYACDKLHDGRPSFTLPGWGKPIHDHGDGGARGDLDLVQAIAKSSNVWFGQLALELGPEPYRALREAGVEFGNPGLDTERDGDFTGLGSAGSRRLAQTGFGQGAGSWNVTQAARLVGAVANGGTYRRCPPDLVLGAECAATSLVDTPSALAPILSGMQGVMRSGTGAKLSKVPGVRIYGKTGTADAPGTRDEAPWRIKPAQTTLPHSWFVAVAEPDGLPACEVDAAGRYVVAAVVPHGGFGASAAGPLAIQAVRALRDTGYLPAPTATTP
ncbi:MAG: penicillin-binding transpeptidase domain-containing protein, partial [Myxococcota bacterium]